MSGLNKNLGYNNHISITYRSQGRRYSFSVLMSLALGCYQFILAILNSIAVYVLLDMRLEFFDPYINKCTNYTLLTSELGKKIVLLLHRLCERSLCFTFRVFLKGW
jgi:hypothetical protein